jgi:hypothetical protein
MQWMGKMGPHRKAPHIVEMASLGAQGIHLLFRLSEFELDRQHLYGVNKVVTLSTCMHLLRYVTCPSCRFISPSQTVQVVKHYILTSLRVLGVSSCKMVVAYG